MIIQNLHQPFIFKQGLNTRIIVSQIQPEKLNFVYGTDSLPVEEDYWKLKILDLNGDITNIITPTTFTINTTLYNVIAECNGFLYNNKLSYVMGLHTTQNYEPLYLYLVVGDFDPNTNTVSNLTVISNTRTGYVKGNDVYSVDFTERLLLVNSVVVFDFSVFMNSVTRIIGVDGENKTIITGFNDTGETLVSYVYSHDDQTFFRLQNTDDEDVYKSSYYGDPTNGTFAYADRIPVGNNDFNYQLNIETGYNLI